MLGMWDLSELGVTFTCNIYSDVKSENSFFIVLNPTTLIIELKVIQLWYELTLVVEVSMTICWRLHLSLKWVWVAS